MTSTETSDHMFWMALDKLVSSSKVVVDRPKGTHHPRFDEIIYPLDYGFLDGTSAMDGTGIDVFVGSGATERVNAVICTVDCMKRDSEIKILLGCDESEMEVVLSFLNQGPMKGILIRREA